MKLITLDPRALKPNPDPTRRTAATPQADALLLATIKAVGIVQPPIISPQQDGGNGYYIQYGHRRVSQAIAAELATIEALVADPEADKDALRAIVENVAREGMNPVDLWRSIERLVGLGWTEESIAIALAQSVRQVRKLRLLANVLPAMLDQMARGDMPSEQQLRVIAAATDEEQAEVWKKHKPKGQPTVCWNDVARALTRTRMYARDASFDDDLAKAYGIVWQEDLFAPANEDSRYTTDVEAFLGAQHEWMAHHLPKRGAIIEVNEWGQPKLPPKAERVYGKLGKSDHVGMYLDRSGKVETVAYRIPKPDKKTKSAPTASYDAVVVAKPRPDVTRKGQEMIGDIRTDALHEALGRAPIEEDTLLALLVLAFAGQNVSVASGASDNPYGHARVERHAVRLVSQEGKLAFDREALHQAARLVLSDVLSCRENRSDSGVVARIVGDAIGADAFLPNMGTEEFLSCLSRPALEGACGGTPVLPRPRVKDTRAELVKHFADGRFVHSSALFAPPLEKVTAWVERFSGDTDLDDDLDASSEESDARGEDDEGEDDAPTEFAEAAE